MPTSILVKSVEFCKLFCAVDNLLAVRRRFHDLAQQRSDHSICKVDFLKLFAVAPDLATHVFDLFDYYHRNAIHYNNFMLAFSIFSHASTAEKVNLIREIFCAGDDREIRRPELIQIVDLILDSACNMMGVNVHDSFYIMVADQKAKAIADELLRQHDNQVSVSFNDLYHLIESGGTFNELRAFVLDAAFRANSLFGSGSDRLPLRWVPNERFTLDLKPVEIPEEAAPDPEILGLHRFIFPEYCIQGYNLAGVPCKRLPEGTTSPTELMLCHAPHVDCDCASDEEATAMVATTLQGYVYKQSWFFRRLKRRWIVLRNNILYSFHKQSSPMPNLVISLAGAVCGPIADDAVPEDAVPLTGPPRYGFQVMSPLSTITRIIYLPTAEQRDRWVRAISIASMEFNLAEHYQMIDVIHQHLPNVFECRGAHTGQHYMLKYIDKSLVKEPDLAMLRVETGVLRFVDHQDIAPSVAVYEDRNRIYLIRRYINLGWIRIDEIVDVRGILSVNSVGLIMRQVISGLTYLHRLGLTLGAFGPTNILLRLDALRQHRIHMVDIGLRKYFVSAMDGETRSYVAPEVERGARPSPKADMWSVGSIMYRLLTPESTREDIELAKQGVLDLSRTRAPPDVVSTIKRLLNRNPSKRYSAADMFRMRWIRDAVEGPFQLRLPRRNYQPQTLYSKIRASRPPSKSAEAEAGERPEYSFSYESPHSSYYGSLERL